MKYTQRIETKINSIVYVFIVFLEILIDNYKSSLQRLER